MTMNQFAAPAPLAPSQGGLAFNRIFVLQGINGLDGQPRTLCGIGICDPSLQISINALVPYIYYKYLHAWKLVASVQPGPVVVAAGGDNANLQLETGDAVILMNAGVGDTIPGGWWVQTGADTNGFKGGPPTDRGYQFVGFGLMVTIDTPYQRGDTNTAATDGKKASNWLRARTNGSSYMSAMQKAHIENENFLLQQGDTGISYRLGLATFQPGWSGSTGSDGSMKIGQTYAPGIFLPFNAAVCFGDLNSTKQARITASFGQRYTIQSDPANPTQSGLTNAALAGTINAANDGTVYQEIIVSFAGMLVCNVLPEGCAPAALSPEQYNALMLSLGAGR